MRIQGERRLGAPPEVVFAAIHDPDRLLLSIPGCEAVERVTDTEYRGRIALAIPVVGGTYAMTIWLVESAAPRSCVLDGEIEGRSGRVTGRVSIELQADAGGTRLSYDGDARLGGPLAWLDSAIVARAAQSIIDQGLGRLDAALPGGGAAPPDSSDQHIEQAHSSMETVA